MYFLGGWTATRSDQQTSGTVATRWSAMTGRFRLSAWSLYRQRDGIEEGFTVCKSDLKVSPIHLHKEERIEAMLPVDMLVWLTYSLPERQVRQKEIPMTTRRIMQKLESGETWLSYSIGKVRKTGSVTRS